MKTRKILLVLVAVMLMMAMVPFGMSKAVTAGTVSPTISVDSINNAKVGEEVTVNVKLDKDIDIVTISTELNFDSTKLEVTNVVISDNIFNMRGFLVEGTGAGETDNDIKSELAQANANGCITLAVAGGSNKTLKAGNIQTITFKVKEGGKQTLDLDLVTLAATGADGVTIDEGLKQNTVVKPGTITSPITITSVKINGEKPASLKVGEKTTLTAAVSPASGSSSVTWTTSDAKVATVNNGVVTAVAVGEATITAKAGEKSDTYTVKVVAVPVPLTGISLNKTSVNLLKGQTSTLQVTYTPSNTTDNKTVTWTSSDSTVATVKDGVVTAVKAGEAVLTAKVGNFTKTCNVKVEEKALTSIALSEEEDFELSYMSSKELKVIYTPADTTDDRTVTWTSSDTKVAKVEDGKVTAVGVGEAIITAKVGKYTAEVKVTVPEVLIQDILLVLESDKVEVDNTTRAIVFTVPGLVTEEVKAVYSSKDAKIAKVDENGVITGVKVGKTTISVEVNGEFKKDVEIEVIEKVVEPDNSGVPVTGDLAIGAFIVLAVVSIAGIAFIVVKKVRK